MKLILMGADLSFSSLVMTKLQGACLCNCNLTFADLRGANFLQADLTGANLHFSARDRWEILNVECDYIYFDAHGEERIPSDRDFEQGEFERLYSSIPTVEIFFKEGMKLIDPLVLDLLAHKLQLEKPELGIELLSIDKRGLYPRAIFSIALEHMKKEIEKELRQRYKNEIEALRSDKDRLFRLLEISMHKTSPKEVNIYGGKYLEARGDIVFNEININHVINEIKDAVEQATEETFKEKSKKKIMEHLDNIAKEATKEGAKAVAKGLYNFAKTELVPILPQIMKILKNFELIT